MEIRVDYKPNKKQVIFHSCGADEVVYGGAKGGGKSCALVMECLAYCLENKGATAYLFRESYDDLEANLIDEWKKKVPEELYEYKETKHVAYVAGGSRVFFRYICGESDAYRYQGRSIDFIGIDELTQHTEKAVQVLLSCLRSPKGFKAVFKGTCNPGGIGHSWVKKRYIDGTSKGKRIYFDQKSGNSVAFVPASVYDNEVIMQKDPKYLRRLNNLPPAEKKAYLYGDWDIFEGQYFSEFDYSVHVMKPFEIPKHWRRYISFDYGLDMLACYFIAVDEQCRAYVYREIYKSGLIVTEAAQAIYKAMGDEKIYSVIAPPDLWNRHSDTGKSTAEIFAEEGIYLCKVENSRVSGWYCLKERLKIFTDEQGQKCAGLRIFNCCENLIRTLPAIAFDKLNPNDCAKVPHELTHAPDAIRYFASGYPLAAETFEAPDGLQRQIEEMCNYS